MFRFFIIGFLLGLGCIYYQIIYINNSYYIRIIDDRNCLLFRLLSRHSNSHGKRTIRLEFPLPDLWIDSHLIFWHLRLCLNPLQSESPGKIDVSGLHSEANSFVLLYQRKLLLNSDKFGAKWRQLGRMRPRSANLVGITPLTTGTLTVPYVSTTLVC